MNKNTQNNSTAHNNWRKLETAKAQHPSTHNLTQRRFLGQAQPIIKRIKQPLSTADEEVHRSVFPASVTQTSRNATFGTRCTEHRRQARSCSQRRCLDGRMDKKTSTLQSATPGMEATTTDDSDEDENSKILTTFDVSETM
eukprot:CAMPEP_0198112424 /NCGR_PEP_ID=MMETSP1442-20131203/4279_1 /TAXON_ID= /ORGANISM="Craspedostauros australis, Strain CCMP3328" /LENGTH=140 /DNA_ID=CAMNT_0043769187 /DNA_START=719 /DNA_END=1142 /DNA_ORIENTATION=-